MTFEEDLKRGKEAEIEFACHLLRRWASWVQLAPDRRFVDWDIKETKWELENTYEIKEDFISVSTGNVWFEFMNRWNPWWVYVSKADFIVYKLEDKFYCVDRGRLLIRLDFVKKERKKWWDWDKSDLFIVKKEDFFSFIDRNWWIW